MPDIEAIGDAATGGVVARAVEPAAGEADGHTQESNCLNCGCQLLGSYCHCCGQRGHVHRTIAAWWHDFLHSVLHLDGKFWRTLPMLVWNPGELTRRYAHGERAKFISPLALFLFTVFLTFAVFSFGGGAGMGGQDIAAARAEAQADFERERVETVQELNAARAERARAAAAGESTASADADIRTLEAELAREERLFRQAMSLIDAEERRERDQAAEEAQRQPGALRESKEQADEGEAVVIAGADSLNQWFNQAYRKAKKNPELLVYKLQTNAYKYSWALIPISVPFLWILFLHRRRYREEFTAYDHLVFVTYSIAFMSLAVVAYILLDTLGLGEGLVGALFLLVPPVHMYRQLRGAYRLSRLSALWRTFVLLIFALVALTLFALLLLVLGVLG